MKSLFLAIMCYAFLSCSNDKHTIKVKGSDTEVNLAVLLAESFRRENQDVLVSITGGGSGMGIASLLNGNADIANSSRRIQENELQLFIKNNIRLDSLVFAQDAIAFVVSSTNPIDSLSITHLSEILSGKLNNWQYLTNERIPINIYGRQSNSGTYEYVKQKLSIQFSPYAKQMNGNSQILEAIKVDNSGIGYVGAGYVLGDNIKGLKILKIYSNNSMAISPLDAAKVISGMYFFQRPLYQYYRREDYHKIKPFLDYEKSAKGKKIIYDSGYYPTEIQ